MLMAETWRPKSSAGIPRHANAPTTTACATSSPARTAHRCA